MTTEDQARLMAAQVAGTMALSGHPLTEGQKQTLYLKALELLTCVQPPTSSPSS